MWTLRPCREEPLDVYDRICKAKRNTRDTLEEIRPKVEERCRLHDDHRAGASIREFPESKGLGLFAEKEIAALESAYRQPTRALGQLKKAIKEAQPLERRDVCPYCGINREPNHFDHLLPLSLFPEFSTHPLNLAPACGLCNGKRGNRWKGGLLLYFDALDEIPQFLEVVLEPGTSLVHARFELSWPSGLPEGQRRWIQDHVRALDLLSRWSLAAQNWIRKQKGWFEPYRRGSLDLDAVREMFRGQAGHLSRAFGVNYWEAVTAGALAEEPRLPALLGGDFSAP